MQNLAGARRDLGELAGERRLAVRVDRAARPRHRDRERGQNRELRRERLGRGDADLRPGQSVKHDVGLARDRAFRLVDDRDDLLPGFAAVAQRRQRVGGLARLRDDERRAVARHRRSAIAELRGDVGLDRNAGDPFEPVFRDHAGVMRGAAGDRRDLADVAERERQIGQMHAACRRVHQRLQRVADDRGLLEDLLLHEMPVIALADQGAGQGRLAHRARDFLVGAVEDRDLARGHDGPIAFFEIGDASGSAAPAPANPSRYTSRRRHSRSPAGCRAGRRSTDRVRRRTGRRARTRLRAAPACAPPPAPGSALAPGDASSGSRPPRCRSA